MNSSFKEFPQKIMFTSLLKIRRIPENSSDSNNLSSNNQDQNNYTKSFVRSDSVAFKSVIRPKTLQNQGFQIKSNFSKEPQVSLFSIDKNSEKQNQLLNKVKEVLIKIFNDEQEGNEIPLNLTNTEIRIIQTIIKKKTKKKVHKKMSLFQDENLTLKDIKKFLQQNLKHKKPEQITKYFIHKFFKYLKQKMSGKRSRQSKIKKKTKDSRFLRFYFKEAAQQHKIPLHYFQDPYLKKNKHPQDKCFIANTTYIGRILLSQKVKEEIKVFLFSELEKVAKNDTKIKLDKIFSKLQKKPTLYFLNQRFEEDVLKPSFKLPWNQFEVIQVIQSIKKLIQQSKELKKLN